ncbi:antibiotic biosynthesis monooxygenase family protein [Calothrix sp. 336/3]|uniref:antibiotic biosynthesis monooxygenase family protein n=1 Tax=Calothrix sp. 336/3 TaxID=1337936 RepID=UPI0004E3B3FF|nr:antibiotic biosynthesis monooxygenase family protein [Calothrix sp. 336/3]AKG24275.1 antibiotic biosynthesis monooxygenase [Calothrix sp. 336/3]
MITFVNVFTVLPDKQQVAFEVVSRVYTEVVKQQPGFIEAKVLVSDDGTRVTAVALWESEEHLAAMRQTPGFKELHNAEFKNAVVSNDGHVYSTAMEVRPSGY